MEGKKHFDKMGAGVPLPSQGGSWNSLAAPTAGRAGSSSLCLAHTWWGAHHPELGKQTSGQEKPRWEMRSPWTPLCLSHPGLRHSASSVWASAPPQDGTAPCPALPMAASSVQGLPASSLASRSPRGPRHPLRGSPPPLPPSGPQNWSLPGRHARPFQHPLCSHRLRPVAACPGATSRWHCSCSLLLTEERR